MYEKNFISRKEDQLTVIIKLHFVKAEKWWRN